MLLRRYEQRRKTRWLRLWRDSLFTKDPAGARLAIPLAACLVYLFAECALSAWLIELCAVDAYEAASSTVCIVGRTLSACAIVLVVWPMLRVHTRRNRALLVSCVLVAGLAWAGTGIERAVLAQWVEDSSAQSRVAALTSMPRRSSLPDDEPESISLAARWPNGMPVSVSGKTVAAMIGFLVKSDPMPPDEAGLEQAYQRYVNSQFTIRDRFLAYRDPDAFRHQAMGRWQEKGHVSMTASRGEQTAFAARGQTVLQQQAHIDGLPSGLSLGQFAAHPLVQESWRTLLGYPPGSPPLSLTPLGRENFALYYFRPFLSAHAVQAAGRSTLAPQRYVNGAEHEAQGRRAYERMVAPILGLALSLLGMLTQLCRAGLLLIQYASGWRFRRVGFELAALAAGVWLICLAASCLPLPLTAEPPYALWSASEGAGSRWLDGLMRLEVIGYPLFDLVFHLLP
ncbi:hypothetical protein FYA67_12625 [Bordetella holmesii]|uniref:Membrane protein n=2 Tax=Bordetella holmesii TaxID=35814 RepID=A0ABN0RZF9_9BORD|nr:putative membrane protein [Bordetella holmesii ATCC 51541]AIT24817.1 putative membrane protein [Bordetella holmesii 44057]AMD44108.1 hypothetical protein H558_00525 [Bordetella holmesii H558]AMD50733.1 hypothetical protein F783_017560 [Bordetella holmesii F627]AOB36218.1 hypothetical protein BBB42_12340 [Bordetella holmesii]EWM45388.1 putative membrane protein [Bordetella holmesii 70147]EWM48530.1 putative membrane protein [Bordetella holmesii 41130]EWM49503.1 putative membrane protein [B